MASNSQQIQDEYLFLRNESMTKRKSQEPFVLEPEFEFNAFGKGFYDISKFDAKDEVANHMWFQEKHQSHEPLLPPPPPKNLLKTSTSPIKNPANENAYNDSSLPPPSPSRTKRMLRKSVRIGGLTLRDNGSDGAAQRNTSAASAGGLSLSPHRSGARAASAGGLSMSPVRIARTKPMSADQPEDPRLPQPAPGKKSSPNPTATVHNNSNNNNSNNNARKRAHVQTTAATTMTTNNPSSDGANYNSATAAAAAISSTTATTHPSNRNGSHTTATNHSAANANGSGSNIDLDALLSAHNRKVKPKSTYVAPMHSVKDIKRYEDDHGVKWHQLSVEERENVNEVISMLKKQRQW
jgi:hypothetical protein